MTIEQQNEISAKYRRFVARYEAMYTPLFNKALRAQINQYVNNGTLMAVTSEPIYPVLLQLYKQTATVWAHQTHIQVRSLKSRQPMGFSERIVELMRQYYGIDLLNIAEGLTQTTKEVIGKVLAEAVQLGWSFNEIVSRLQSPELTRIRARLIARTETVSSANSAAMINAKETAARSKLVLNKIWIATSDSRTRPDHREVNGQIIGIDDFFTVGGFLMGQPGDRTHGAPAGEIVNCRCRVAFVPVT